MSPPPSDLPPDFVAQLGGRLGRAGRAVARFTFETAAGLGLRTALPPHRGTVAAERDDREELEREAALRLPWSDRPGFPRALAELGVLLEALRVAPGDGVVELAGGETGWRSHFLNLYGCPTVTIDHRAPALDSTRALFRRHAGTRWDLDPRFVLSDGRRIPLPDGTAERLLLPVGPPLETPPAEFLAELHRVTRAGGRVVLRLPARRLFRRRTGGIEAFAREARRAGFSAVSVVPWSAGGHEVPAERFAGFLGGRGLLEFWQSFAAAQLAAPLLILSKGVFVPTTRRPGRLAGRIEVLSRREGDEPLWLEAQTGVAASVHCRITNLGDTCWLGGERSAGEIGATRLALRLGPAQGPASALTPWHGLPLPADLLPGERVEIEIELPAVPEPGDYRLGLGLEAEGIGPFGSECPGVELRLQVR